METRLINNNQIPNMIHIIWLGAPPKREVLKNVAHWKITNPSYQVILWIDSSTYSTENRLQALLENLKRWLPLDLKKYLYDIDKEDNQALLENIVDRCMMKWAEDHGVCIYDLARKEDTVFEEQRIHGKFNFYKNMLSKHYYNDEVSGRYANFAAASDIARVEFLFRLGGIYVDAEDVCPGEQDLPQTLTTTSGFYCNISRKLCASNRILASVPSGKIITAYREFIQRAYQEFYLDQEKLAAHRQNGFYGPRLFQATCPRLFTTMELSGPTALSIVLKRFILEFNPSLQEKFSSTITLDPLYFSASYASSWHQPLTLDEFVKGFVREYLIDCIQLEAKNISKLASSEQAIQNTLVILKKLTHWLKTLYWGWKASDFAGYLHALPEKEKKLLEQYRINIIDRIIHCTHATDDFTLSCLKNNFLNEKAEEELISFLEKAAESSELRHALIQKVIDNGSDEANLAAFREIIENNKTPFSTPKLTG